MERHITTGSNAVGSTLRLERRSREFEPLLPDNKSRFVKLLTL